MRVDTLYRILGKLVEEGHGKLVVEYEGDEGGIVFVGVRQQPFNTEPNGIDLAPFDQQLRLGSPYSRAWRIHPGQDKGGKSLVDYSERPEPPEPKWTVAADV